MTWNAYLLSPNIGKTSILSQVFVYKTASGLQTESLE